MASGIQFDEDKFNYSLKPQPNVAHQPGQYSREETTGLTGWLIRKGWVKSSNTAQIVLIAVVVTNIIITFIVLKFFL